MKRIAYLILLMALIACTDDEPNTGMVYYELQTKLCPGDEAQAMHSQAYLYPASNGEAYELNTYDYDPNDVLEDPQAYPLKTGVGANYSSGSIDNGGSGTMGVFNNVKPGRYLLVLFFRNADYYAFDNKYTATYIDVAAGDNFTVHQSTIGGDVQTKGFQQWQISDWTCAMN